MHIMLQQQLQAFPPFLSFFLSQLFPWVYARFSIEMHFQHWLQQASLCWQSCIFYGDQKTGARQQQEEEALLETCQQYIRLRDTATTGTWAYLLLLLYILTHLASCWVWTTMLALHFLNRFLFQSPSLPLPALCEDKGPSIMYGSRAANGKSSLLFFSSCRHSKNDALWSVSLTSHFTHSKETLES